MNMCVKMKLFILFVFSFCVACKGQTISGGSPTTISEYPFATSLLFNSGTTFQYACGGSVLTTTSILSAASCFYTDVTLHEPAQWQARVGSSYANSGGTVHQIVRITIHPDFELSTKVNDIAILRVDGAGPIVLQPGVVQVASIAANSFTFQQNHRVRGIGWGSAGVTDTNRQLHHVQTFAIDQDVCAVRYNDFEHTITDNMVCVGWLDVGVHGQCPEGGAGSPVVVDGIVVGVYSWSQGCALLRYPNINTRVSMYWRWIVEVANERLS